MPTDMLSEVTWVHFQQYTLTKVTKEESEKLQKIDLQLVMNVR